MYRTFFFRMLATVVLAVTASSSGCQSWNDSYESGWDDGTELSKVAAPGNPPNRAERTYFSDKAHKLDMKLGR